MQKVKKEPRVKSVTEEPVMKALSPSAKEAGKKNSLAVACVEFSAV